MTELELFYHHVPDIAEILCSLRKKTPDQRQEWKRRTLEHAEGLGPYVHGFIRKMILVIDSHLEKEESVHTVKIEDIRIYPCFAVHEPKPEKMEHKEWLYAESGLQKFSIILDHNNYLVDGYCGYLLAKRYGLTHVPVRYGRRQTVRAMCIILRLSTKQFISTFISIQRIMINIDKRKF